MSPAFQESSFGKLWEKGSEGMSKYNFLNKREPMDRALDELGANLWMAGFEKARQVLGKIFLTLRAEWHF